MDVRYNSEAAHRLIEKMEQYCAALQKNGQDLANIIGFSAAWQDRQYESFRNQISSMFQDLNAAMGEQQSYLESFRQKVQELE